MALLRLPTTQIHACSKAAKGNTHLSTMHTTPTAQVLASAIYYDAGRRYAVNRKWNHMTHLQMCHELRLRGKLAEWEGKEEGDGGLSEWKMRMRMVRVTLEEQEEGKRMEEMRARDREEAETRGREKEDMMRREEERIERIIEALKKESGREESSRKRKREEEDEVAQSPPWMRMRLSPQSSLTSGVVGNGNGVDCGVWGRC
jgi:hypothetical protein